MPEPVVSVVVRQQELAAPHGPVVAVAGAVECDADHAPGAVQAVFGHRRGDVRVMVLYAYDLPFTGQTAGQLSRAVSGMPVDGQGAGSHPGDGLQLLSGVLEGVLGGEVVHVADVGGQPGPAPLRQTQGVLEVTARGEDRRYREGQFDGPGA